MAVLMVAALAAVAQPGDMDGPPGGPGMGGPGRGGFPGMMGPGADFLHPRMLKELGLSEAQQKQMRDQRLAFQKQRIQIQSEKSILELDLQNVLATAPVKEAEALKVAEKIAAADRKALLLRVESMSRFLAGLTPEQHRKVMEYQAELREKRKTWREEMDRGWKRHHREDSGDSKQGKR
jgi:Spy/CpxP family protein refolding chaperone